MSSLFPASISDALSKSNVVSGLAKGGVQSSSSNGGVTFNNDGTIKQTERLLTARPRYAPTATTPGDVYRYSVEKRGTPALIKLLTSTELATAYSTTRGLRETPDLTGPGSDLATMSNNDSSKGYDKFLLTAVSCQLQEKLQVTETFGDGEVAYYFGRQPITVDIAGVLIDSPDNSWFSNWLNIYSGVLRGSQLAQKHELLKLVLPNMILTGSITGTRIDQNSGNDVAIAFSFQFLAKKIEPVAATLQNVTSSTIGDLIDFEQAAKFVSQKNINSLKNQVATLSSVVSSPTSTLGQLGAALSNIGSGAGGSVKSAANSLIDSLSNNAFSKGLVSSASLFNTLSANLNGLRTQLFSPIYGVLTGLTKLVTIASGNVSSIFNSLFSPVRNILRDITNISNQAIALVSLVNSSIRGIGRALIGQIAGTSTDFNNAMKSVGKAAGSIATSPKTILQSLQGLVASGSVSTTAAFLRENKASSLSSTAALSGTSRSDYKLAILRGYTQYTPAKGAFL